MVLWWGYVFKDFANAFCYDKAMDKVAGIILLVDDIKKSTTFYEKLGFIVTEEKLDIATTLNLGDFWVELLHKSKVVSEEYKEDAGATHKGAGIYLQVQVKDVDAVYKKVVANGIRPLGKPQDYPWQQREFIVTDPNGYRVAFFSML